MSKCSYFLSWYATGFMLSLLIVTYEDVMHGLGIIESLSMLHHYTGPLFIGLFAAMAGYSYGYLKSKKLKSIKDFNKKLESFMDINQSLISCIDLDKILQIIIDTSSRIAGIDSGAIYLVDSHELYLGATTPPLPPQFPEALRHDVLDNHPHISKSVQTKKAVCIDDTSSEQLSEQEMLVVKARNLKSILYIPLVIENRTVGILILGTIEQKRKFLDSDIAMFSSFSVQAALAIENSLLFKKTIQITQELKQQNEEFLTLNEELSENYKRINKINEELKLAKEKAEESDRLKSAFLQNMSHEVRTPLNAIVGFSGLISSPNLDSKKLESFQQMISISSEKLINIISDVIEISHIHANLVKVKYLSFDIIRLIKTIATHFSGKLINKNIKLNLNIPANKREHFITSDPEKLERIYSHLIDNAIKFTIQGEVAISLELNDKTVHLSVSDTGIGIPEHLQKTIFEPFRQVETGIIRDFGGNGLGLSIAKSYTQMLQGEISFKSKLGEGSTFTVTIPLTHKESTKESNEITGDKTEIKTVLIAEDEYTNYLLLVELLSEFNFKIIYAENGKKAVDIVKTNGAIDLILMDIKMPIMDGHTAAIQIREHHPHMKIIAQSAYTHENEIEKFRGVFIDYISKPINCELLKQKIKDIAQNK